MTVKLQNRATYKFMVVQENGDYHLFWFYEDENPQAGIIITKDGPKKGPSYAAMVEHFDAASREWEFE
jgi:hypothetical protein